MGMRKLSEQHTGSAWPKWGEILQFATGGGHLASAQRPSGGGGGGGATTLNGLTDVSAAAPADTEVLTWVNANSAWESAAAAVAGTLDSLTDVAVAAPADTNVLTWVNANSAWEAAAASAGASALNDLTDVSAAAPVDGEVIKWINANSAWEAASVGALTAALNDLTDVSAAAPADTEVLTWVNANSAWESAAAVAGGGGGTHRWNMFSPPAGGSTYPLIVVNATGTVVKVRCLHRGSGSVDVNVTKNLRGAPADVIVTDLTSSDTAWVASATLSVGVVSGDELDVELVGVAGNVELVTVQVEIS